jgi:hypothetical protein
MEVGMEEGDLEEDAEKNKLSGMFYDTDKKN